MQRIIRDQPYLFANSSITEYFDSKKNELTASVKKFLSFDNISLIDKPEEIEKIINILKAGFSIEQIVLLTDKKECSVEDIELQPNEIHPANPVAAFSANITRRTVSSKLYRYFIPFSGNEKLFYLIPSNPLVGPFQGTIKDNEIIFEIRDTGGYYAGGQETWLKNEINNKIQQLSKTVDTINIEITNYNYSLDPIIKTLITNRINDLKQHENTINRIGIPLRAKPETSITPKLEAKNKLVSNNKIKANEVYSQSIELIERFGESIEKDIRTFTKLSEENIRSLIAAMLATNFPNQVNSEALNGMGKTDIIIKSSDKTELIAECKFWTGKEGYFATIDQLLGYVTWADQYAAIIIFNKNKNLTNVINLINAETKNHPNYDSTEQLGQNNENKRKFIFYFKNKDDEQREFILTVLLYNITDKSN